MRGSRVAILGALAYGATEDKALAAVKALVLRVLADRSEHGETAPGLLEVSFVTHAA